MVRTQIQLDEKQAEALKRIAAAQKVSMAEIIRRGVDLYLKTSLSISDDERRQRAIRASGKFRSGKGDLAKNHDAYLAEAYAE